MFSDEELALLDSIHADPREDAPRLAYADWLDANGNAEYAEFTRLDILLWNDVIKPGLTDETRYQKWCVPQDSDRHIYLESISQPWAAPVPSFGGTPQFDRGVFLVELEDITDSSACLQAIMSASPRLRYILNLRLTTPGDVLDLLGTGRVGVVRFQYKSGDYSLTGDYSLSNGGLSNIMRKLMEILFSCPHVERLEAVKVPLGRLLDEEARQQWVAAAQTVLAVPWIE